MTSPLTWAAPNNIVWVVLITVFAVGALVYRLLKVRSSVERLAATKHAAYLLPNYSFGKQVIKTVLMLTGLFFLALALLRPQWGKRETVVAQEGRDLFIALDISRSMLAQDCQPNRLAVAKEKIKKLLPMLTCERVGLIVFSGSTFIQCPLTSDYGAFYLYLDAVGVETISSGTTALDQAVKKGLQGFIDHEDKKTKLLVVFTDGEDFSSDLAGVKQEAAQKGMTIFTVGIGTTQGAPVPQFDAHGKQIGHQQDKKGKVVISRLNEGILKSLAQDCGGTFIAMTPDNTDMQTLLAYVQKFEKDKREDKKLSLFEERYNYCVAISFVCFILEWLL